MLTGRGARAIVGRLMLDGCEGRVIVMLLSELPHLNAIKVGNFFLKSSDVYDTVTRCCRSVFHEAEDRELPLGLAGTSTLISYREQKYIITTRHQLGVDSGEFVQKELLDTVRIASNSEKLSNIPTKACFFEKAHLDEEFHDILIFEVDSSSEKTHLDAPYFFPIQKFSQLDRRASALIGNPIIPGIVMGDYLDAFFLGEAAPIHIKRAITGCTWDSEFRSHARYLLKFDRIGKNIEIDGHSGGAVFSLVGDLGSLEIVLDGIVLRGGVENFYAISVDYILSFLERIYRA